MNRADYLIVGQGIGGSVLAWTLDQLGCNVIVANAPGGPAASRVAAGIVNPLTGRKLVRTWKADQLFPYLQEFYTGLERKLDARFYHPLNIYRPFRSIEEQNAYIAQTAEPSLHKYVNEVVNNEPYSPYIHNPFGGLEVTHAGWVDLVPLLEGVREYFAAKGQYLEKSVQVSAINFRAEQAEWEGCLFNKIIFCDGVGAQQNPLFSWLPFNPVKGQLLTAQVEHYPIGNIVNQGVFILPVNSFTIKIGATYTWHDLDWQTTVEAREFLLTKVRDILKVPFEITAQQAGIRPSTKDRRPLVGLHPEIPSAAIFGGLGTKGVSLAPYLAHQFAQFLLRGEELESEANISRYLSLYYSTKM